jgi:mono/diheme cytochrome c family protein
MTNYQEERVPIPTPWRLIRELRLKRPPWWMILALVIAVIATWIPLAMIYRARHEKSRLPRVHFIHDMDHQPRFGPQDPNPWFHDGRAMRLPIEGTIARGRLVSDQHLVLGYCTSDGTKASAVTEFAKELPESLRQDLESLVSRGENRYMVYCAVCHGTLGKGDGVINQRAIELKEAKWVPATNLLTQMIRDRADGQLFQAISDGVRSMPSYGAQISVRDRWAIVAFLRKLQRENPVAEEPKLVSPPIETPRNDQASPTEVPR